MLGTPRARRKKGGIRPVGTIAREGKHVDVGGEQQFVSHIVQILVVGLAKHEG